jgi:hypothetical protein
MAKHDRIHHPAGCLPTSGAAAMLAQFGTNGARLFSAPVIFAIAAHPAAVGWMPS